MAVEVVILKELVYISVFDTGFEKSNIKGGETLIGSCKNVPDCGYGHNPGWSTIR